MSTKKITKALSLSLSIAAASAVVASAAIADTYRLDLEVGAGVAENDVIGNGANQGDFDTEQASLVGSVYFSDVDTDKGPYAEAAFLNKSSFARVGVTHFNDVFATTSAQVEETFGTLRVVAQDRVIVEGTAASGGIYHLEAGAYLTDMLAVTAGYTRVDEDGDNSYSENLHGVLPIGTRVYEHNYESYSVNVHGVLPIGDVSAFAYDASGGYINSRNTDGGLFQGEITYYLLQSLGLSAQGGYTTVSGNDLWSVGAGAEYFITPKLSVGVDYNYVETDESNVVNDSGDTIYLEINKVSGNLQFRF